MRPLEEFLLNAYGYTCFRSLTRAFLRVGGFRSGSLLRIALPGERVVVKRICSVGKPMTSHDLTEAERTMAFRASRAFVAEDGAALIIPFRCQMRGVFAVLLEGASSELVAPALLWASLALEFLDGPEPVVELTPREKETLTWVLQGKTDWEIAQICGVSQKTINKHVESSKAKLGVVNRARAAETAWRQGLLVA